VSGSGTAAPIIIATGEPVVTMGGFTGGDPAPTVSQLAAMVRSGRLKYVLLGGGAFGGGPGGGGTQSAIEQWVQAHGKAVSGVGTAGGTLYEVSA
jgi:4-amino-4-deoxy-L-arabinose transferase-like glycosyltransferase